MKNLQQLQKILQVIAPAPFFLTFSVLMEPEQNLDLGADLEEPKEKSQTPTDSFLNWSVQDVNDWVDKAFDKADQDEIKQLKLSGEILSSVREKDLANVSLGTRKRLIEKIQGNSFFGLEEFTFFQKNFFKIIS